ncbi:ribbon-helix-helix protein, CopG family [Mycetocola tolaasinivorans]|uniref:Ribbon-helix-helix protein, CopG family n=1 Tax=Mycetocola tolaasinivorans TaxID=76635 RepID=A0A3L7A2U4_9MICO|nr:ribbon-helix-helix protein, CopG family [Mycetocola tolaasinivorans]RLP74325.1 ribbon-helix-helix protein, CopG family [Mycetocola tolaasinivorans]
MNNGIATPENGSYGQIDGVEITETVIAGLVKNAEEGFPGATIRPTGRPARASEPSQAVTVRLSESELAALMARAERENLGRSEAIRAALAAWASPAS